MSILFVMLVFVSISQFKSAPAPQEDPDPVPAYPSPFLNIPKLRHAFKHPMFNPHTDSSSSNKDHSASANAEQGLGNFLNVYEHAKAVAKADGERINIGAR